MQCMSIIIGKKGTDLKHMAVLQYPASTFGVCEIGFKQISRAITAVEACRDSFEIAIDPSPFKIFDLLKTRLDSHLDVLKP